MEKIKLVIWDLDETFWKGTLSEEGIQPIDEHTAIVKQLCDRGIVNSISSKNDFEDAKKKLTELNVWDYFVFPTINWQAKGPAIKALIQNCQLRDVNVLFIDDNHLNLKEAKHYNPNLHVKTPDFINQLLTHPALKGKDDRTHSRLKQYKILEQKYTSSLAFSDNVDFLRSSNIKIQRIEGQDLLNYTDRIYELIERTNQLNYTKIRSSKEEIITLLNDLKFKSGIVRVYDKFGDYGITGFYSLNTQDNKLIHFVFSCRILNLGVVQYMYNSLNRPQLNIMPEVAEKINNSTPDWITEITEAAPQKMVNKNMSPSKRILFKGGCDLGQVTFYLQDHPFEFINETNYVAKDNFPIHQEHTQALLNALQLSEEHKKYTQEHAAIPFIDDNFYKTDVFSENYDCMIYSVLMDYTQELYQHNTKDILLPFGGYNDWTNKDEIEKNLEGYRRKQLKVTHETITTFSKEFRHIGQISPEQFTHNLQKIRSLIPAHIPMIFINGASLPSPSLREPNASDRHILMNNALETFINTSENTYLVDVTQIITSPNQLTDNIRHYNRKTYKEISIKILELLNQIFDEEISTTHPTSIKVKEKIAILKEAVMPILKFVKIK